MAALYQFQPPLRAADLTLNLDQMVSSGMDTLVYIAGLIGGSVLYDSKVAQKIGDNVDRWVHPDEFRMFREQGEEMGFGSVFSGPLVRSSYRADEQQHAARAVAY